MQPGQQHEPEPGATAPGSMAGFAVLWRIFLYLLLVPTLFVLAAKWLLKA
jgi:hypothetical protein